MLHLPRQLIVTMAFLWRGIFYEANCPNCGRTVFRSSRMFHAYIWYYRLYSYSIIIPASFVVDFRHRLSPTRLPRLNFADTLVYTLHHTHNLLGVVVCFVATHTLSTHNEDTCSPWHEGQERLPPIHSIPHGDLLDAQTRLYWSFALSLNHPKRFVKPRVIVEEPHDPSCWQFAHRPERQFLC